MQSVEADKAFTDVKKEEHTDGYIVKGKKVIYAATRKGSLIDKAKLKKDHKSIYDAYLKQDKDSVSLAVIEDKNLLQEQKENVSTNL